MRTNLRNIVAVARREFLWRVANKSFLINTLLLVVISAAVVLAPIGFRLIDRNATDEQIALYTGSVELPFDPIPTLQESLSAIDASVSAIDDLTSARAEVVSGDLLAVMALDRSETGDLVFTLYESSLSGQQSALLQQAAMTLALQDRLTQHGIVPSDQAALFVPPALTIEAADPDATPTEPGSPGDVFSPELLSFAFSLLIFLAIVMYGSWIGMSVAEEKTSRVMEVILGAATPFQLLTGKVLGVGAVGLVQYLSMLTAAGVAIALEAQIASLVLGIPPEAASIPAGITLPLLLLLGTFLILGFTLYATLFAGAASLVSRQEDVNTMMGPLILIATLGYFVGVYSLTGVLDLGSPLMVALSYFPFTSPYLMMSRVLEGGLAVWELPLSLGILAISIVVALWVAARLYSAGVLMYGQNPGLRDVIRAFLNAGR